MENILKTKDIITKVLIIKPRVWNKQVIGSENKETSIHGYNEWKNHKVKLRSSSPLRCAKTASFFSSPACVSPSYAYISFKIRQKMFLYQPP